MRSQSGWRRWRCRACGAPVRYGRNYCPSCEDEVYIDEVILAPQADETLWTRKAAGEARLRDARGGKLREE
jgi:uncharacterized Zn finger protein (UPF0148 family)